MSKEGSIKKRLHQKALEEVGRVRHEVLKQMATLAASGFGLVSALAWNDLVRDAIDSYIKPYVTVGAGLVSQLLYASIITLLAVVVMLQLTRLAESSQPKEKAKE